MKHFFLIVLVLAFLPFLFHIFLEFPLGGDAPYFFVLSCGQNVVTDSIPLLSKLFFEALPCNLFLFKSLSFFVLIISSFIVAKTGLLFDKKNGWLAGVLVFFSVAWIHSMIQVEDDLLGYPIVFLANYFFLKGQLEESNKLRGIAVALIILTGALFWRGALLYLVAYSFFWVPALITLFVVLYNIGFGSMHALLGNAFVFENMNALMAGGLGLGHGIALFGLYLLIKNYLQLKQKALYLIVPFFVAMLFNVKWAIHVSPFLGLGLMFMVQDFEEKKHRFFRNDWGTRNFKRVVVGLVFVMVFGLCLGFFLQVPHSNQVQAIKDTVRLSERTGLSVSNDWSYGYLIRFFGGVPDNEGGGKLESELSLSGIVLTEQELNCKLVKNYGKGFNFDLKVFDCQKEVFG